MVLRGERLNKPTYSFLQSLGGGTTGEVSLWDHEIFGVPVVQKTVSLLGVPDGLARSEPRLLEGLRHDHLVRVREAQWDPELDSALVAITFTSDYYPGRSVLTALEDRHQFSVGDALGIVDGLLEACAYLHDEKGMLHRDIKPGNVMLDRDRIHPYLGDLGSATWLDLDTKQAGVAEGTPLYRPPEAVNGVIDARYDLYGVGTVLLEMINGILPYEDLNRDQIDARLAQGRRALPDRYYVPAQWVPPKAATVLRRLTARHPNDRYKSADEALRAVRNAACVSWRRTQGVGLVGEWHGTWPPHVRRSQMREYEITIESITNGRYRGQVRMNARWKAPGKAWRGYASLARRADADDAPEAAKFFRAVEAAAHSAPVA